MTKKKALDAAHTLKKYCRSICCNDCIFKDRRGFFGSCSLENRKPVGYHLERLDEEIYNNGENKRGKDGRAKE